MIIVQCDMTKLSHDTPPFRLFGKQAKPRLFREWRYGAAAIGGISSGWHPAPPALFNFKSLESCTMHTQTFICYVCIRYTVQ